MCSPRPAEPPCVPVIVLLHCQHSHHCLYSAGQLSTETALASQAGKAGPRLSTISLSSQHWARDTRRVQGQLVMKTLSQSHPLSAGIIRKLELELVLELSRHALLLHSKQDNDKNPSASSPLLSVSLSPCSSWESSK